MTASLVTEWRDDFTDGLSPERWQLMSDPTGFAADDGVVAQAETGIVIQSSGHNPDTGEPMIVKDGAGHTAHLKWLATTTRRFSTDAGPLRVSFRSSARTYGVERHPYGNAVADPSADIRLGSATLNVIDFASGLVFDFFISDGVVVPFYERLRLPGSPTHHQSFVAVAEPVPRGRDDVHDLAIVIDAAAGTAVWEVDGREVARVGELGPAAGTPWSTILDHGGVPERIAPEGVLVAVGLLTLLDASLPPSPAGLVDVGTHLEAPTAFATDGPMLFGQGVQLSLHSVVVERLAADESA